MRRDEAVRCLWRLNRPGQCVRSPWDLTKSWVRISSSARLGCGPGTPWRRLKCWVEGGIALLHAGPGPAQHPRPFRRELRLQRARWVGPGRNGPGGAFLESFGLLALWSGAYLAPVIGGGDGTAGSRPAEEEGKVQRRSSWREAQDPLARPV